MSDGHYKVISSYVLETVEKMICRGELFVLVQMMISEHTNDYLFAHNFFLLLKQMSIYDHKISLFYNIITWDMIVE